MDTADNRPFLRTSHAVGLELIKEGHFEKAVNKFNFILKVNPGDSQGVRFLLPECLLQLEKYLDFIVLNETSEDKESIEYSYARVLSYFKLDDLDNPRVELSQARRNHPFVADELVKDSHAFPKDEF